MTPFKEKNEISPCTPPQWCDVASLPSLRGVAIVSAMVVITMVASTASWLLYGQNLAINRLARIVTNEQAFLLALGAEARAKELLDRDAIGKSELSTDYYAVPGDKTVAEEWSWSFEDIAPGFETEPAKISWCLYDLLGYLNLNNLYSEFRGIKGVSNWTRDRFLQAFNLRSDSLEDTASLLNSLLDWFDPGNNPRSGGAENSDYLNLVPPYVVSGLRMAWPSEIRLVKGFTSDVTRLFLPYMSALPDPGRITPINVNTAPAGVLFTLPGFEPATVGELIAWREEAPFTSGEQFWQIGQNVQGVANPVTPEWVKKHLDVKSYFFQASINVQMGDTAFEMQSLIIRPLKSPRYSAVLQRRIGSNAYGGCGNRKNDRQARENDLDQT